MAKLPDDVQAETAAATALSYDPITPGIYRAFCVSMDYQVPTKARDGLMFVAVVKLANDQTDIEGNAVRRIQLFHRINYAKPDASDDARKMAASRRKEVFDAFELTTDSDDHEFVDRQCMIQVGVRTSNGRDKTADPVTGALVDPKENYVQRWFPINGAVAQSAGGGSGAATETPWS